MESAQIADTLRKKFPDAVTGSGEFRGQASISIKRENLLDIMQFLRDDPALLFDFLKDICGVDNLGRRDVRFEVVYHLYSLAHEHLIRVKVPVAEADCTITSVISLWRGADWHERECFDLFGITFTGHPDLRRILLPDDWDGHPLRKDYPVKGPETEWPGYVEVLKKAEEYRKYEWNR